MGNNKRQLTMAKDYHQKELKFGKKETNSANISRRKFMGSIIVGSTAATLLSTKLFGNSFVDNTVLSDSKLKLISSVQNMLFPSDGNGPGAHDVLADKYLLWVLSDARKDPEEKNYIINGIGWVEETSNETFSMSYNELTQVQKENLITLISKEKWGKSWLGEILNYIFEALLSDPQYGSNPDSIGWKWLKHNPGFPRPTKILIYPDIIKTVSYNN